MSRRCIEGSDGFALCGQRLPVAPSEARAACFYCLTALDARIKREHAQRGNDETAHYRCDS